MGGVLMDPGGAISEGGFQLVESYLDALDFEMESWRCRSCGTLINVMAGSGFLCPGCGAERRGLT